MRIGLPWLVFLSSFFLVLLLQPPLLYVVWVLTAMGIFYLGLESNRLKYLQGSVYALSRKIIRIGFAIVTAAAMISLLANLVLGNDLPPFTAVSSLIVPLWVLGTLVAFGGVLYARVEGSDPQEAT